MALHIFTDVTTTTTTGFTADMITTTTTTALTTEFGTTLRADDTGPCMQTMITRARNKDA